MKYSSWGCGNAGSDGKLLIVNLDDRRHDHACVKVYTSTVSSPSYTYAGIQSCGAPVSTTKNVDGSHILKVRLYRFSPYGTNYQTLCSGGSPSC